MTINTPIRFETAAEAVRYIMAGYAIVTVVSNKTNVHFTYKILLRNRRYLIYVRTKHGYKFIMFLLYNGRKIQYAKNGIGKNHILVKAFRWTWGHLSHNSLPKTLSVYRYNLCCRCGKRLTTPESIKKGIGPICEKHLLGGSQNGWGNTHKCV